MPRSRPSWAELVVATGAIAVGVAAESQSYAWSDTRHWVPDVLTGWTLVACGVLARRRTGVLLAATGFAWFAGNFASTALVLHRGPLAHLLLTYPQGARALWPAVAFAYVAAAFWSNDAGTIAIAATLAVGASWRSVRSIGRRRREARYAFRAAGVFTAVLGIVAAVNLASDTMSARDTALAVYQAALCGIAVYLTYGALQRPWERPAVTDLVVDLGETRAATIRDALAQALGDPTLEVAYRLDGGYVDAAGRPTSLPANTTRQVTRIERDGEEVAVLVHDPAVLDDPGLVEAVAAATRLAARNARLQADVQAQVAELEASRRRLVEAADTERRRLEERLREGAARRLSQLEERLADARVIAGAAAPAIAQAEDQLAKTVSDLQLLAAGLHPHELSEHGLAAAVASLAERFPIPVDVDVRIGRLPEHLEATVFFVCSEALANVAKHAQASRVSVWIEEHPGMLLIEIGDDGRGGAEPRSISDRVEAVGGTLEVDSPPAGGTLLRASVPSPSAGRSAATAATTR